MNDSDKRKFYDLLLGTYEIYNKPKPTNIAARMWWDEFKCYSFEMVSLAIAEHRRTNKFMPRPAEIHTILHLALDHAKYRQRTPSIAHKMTKEERAKGLDKLREAKNKLNG